MCNDKSQAFVIGQWQKPKSEPAPQFKPVAIMPTLEEAFQLREPGEVIRRAEIHYVD
jgi:hypothetical protein